MVARLLERLWYGRSWLTALLVPASWLFACALRLRRDAYRRGWLKIHRLPVPVVVVGNITVGGTGKTPVVEWLVKQLQACGCQPGIVSRGYGGRSHAQPLLVEPRSAVAEVGDEPLLLARRTGAPVAVCNDRARAAERLMAAGVRMVVSDDGLQHYGLGRDLEIVVVDGERGFGNGRLLPAGPLREPLARLQEADFVLVNGRCGHVSGVCFSLTGDAAVHLSTGEARALSSFSGARVWAVAGIGNPQRFYAQLQAAGIDPVPVPVPDHGRTDLVALARKDDRPVLMTEKDAVKYRRSEHPSAWYVPVRVDMPADIAARIMTRVRSLLATPASPDGGGTAIA